MDTVKHGIPVRQSSGRVKKPVGHSGVGLQTVVRIFCKVKIGYYFTVEVVCLG